MTDLQKTKIKNAIKSIREAQESLTNQEQAYEQLDNMMFALEDILDN